MAALEDLSFLLVVMFIHLFDEDGLEHAAFAFDVDDPVGIVETDGAIAEPLAIEGVVTLLDWHIDWLWPLPSRVPHLAQSVYVNANRRVYATRWGCELSGERAAGLPGGAVLRRVKIRKKGR